MVSLPNSRKPGSGILALALLLTCTGQLHAAAMNCLANGGSPPKVRAEGKAEQPGDYLLSCTGGTVGLASPFVITFTVNTSVANASEALLLVNDPTPAAQVVGTNVFPSAFSTTNSVTFNASLTEPGLGNTLLLRVTNVRVNVNQLPGPFPNQVVGQINVTGGSGAIIPNASQTIAFGMPGLSPPGAPVTFPLCSAVNPQLAGNPNATGGLVNLTATFGENYAGSFKIRNIAGGGATPPAPQNVPGFPYNTETGFFAPQLPLGSGTGLASHGTRVSMELAGIAPGVSVYTTVTPTAASPAIGLNGARLVTTDANGTGPFNPTPPTTNVIVNGNPIGIAPVMLTGGTGRAVWEIVNASPFEQGSVSFGIVLADAVPPMPPSAATITGLFNTGVNNSGVVLANGSIDPHYILTVNPNSGSPNAFVVINGQFPLPPWLADSSTSKWIGPIADQSNFNAEPVSGNYTYRISFTCVGNDCGTVVLNGNWASDNIGNILLNGSGAGIGGSPDMSFSSFTPFSVTGLIQGTNTLDFVVNNAGGTPTATGLRVEISSPPPGQGPGTLSLGYAPAGSDTTSKPRFAEVFNLAATLSSAGCMMPPPPGPQPPVITTPSPLKPGTVGAQYSQTFTASGGTPPLNFSEFGNFPPLLGFSAKGVMSGIPLQAGTYNFTVEVDDSANQFAQKNFTVTINPALAISPPSLPGGGVGLPYSQTITATGGTAPIAFSFFGQLPPGLTLSQAGVLSGKPTAAGTFLFSIMATDAANAMVFQTYQVAIEALPAQVSPSAIKLQGPAMGSKLPPQAITISTGVGPATNFTVSILPGACGNPFTPSVSPLAGTTPAVLTITADPTNLADGVYCAIIRIIIADAPLHPVDIPIDLTLVTTAPALFATPAALQFTATPLNRGPFTGALTVRNTGSGRQAFTASRADNASWVVSVSAGGVAGPNSPGQVAVDIDATGLPPGFYRSGVLLAFGQNALIVPVLLYVSPDSSAPSVDKRSVRFKSRPGSSGAFTQTVTVLDVGDKGTSVDWTAEVSYDVPQGVAVGVHWLTLGARTGTAKPGNGSPLAISLSQEAAGLPPGLYTAIVIIKASPPDQMRAPQFVTVLLEQTDPAAAPEPELIPGGLLFKTKASAGVTPTQTLNLFATIDPPFHVSTQTTDGKNWLLVTPQSGSAAAAVANQLLVQVDPTGLPPGVYRGEVDVELGGNIRGENVTLVVLKESAAAAGQEAALQDDAPPVPCGSQLAITLTSPLSHFFTTAGFPETVIAMVTDDCGNLLPGATVSASFSTGDSQLNLSGSSPDGVYAATWVPTNFANQVAITVDASFVVSPGDQNTPPVILTKTEQFTGGVAQPGTVGPPLVTSLNANSPDPVAVGSTSTVLGTRLFPSTSTSADGSFALTILSGTTVFVAGAAQPALLGAVNYNSVMFRVPQVTGPRIFPVLVNANGFTSLQPLFLRVQ